MKLSFSALVFLAFSQPLLADLTDLELLLVHRQLKIGVICEALAGQMYHELLHDSPELNRKKGFRMMTNIHYTIGNSRESIGELDIVILQKNRIALVAEVKCGRDAELAMEKAQEQMERFTETCGAWNCKFWADGKQIEIETPRYMDDVRIHFVSYKGAGNGFIEMGFGLEQIQAML